jgi:hypothetical protein
VIREREGDETAAAHPTTNAAENDAIQELLSGRRRGVDDRLIAVCPMESF